MSDYIKREDAIKVLEEMQKKLCPVGLYGRNYVYGTDRETYDELSEIINTLENIPTADVVEVKHEKWIKDEGGIVICSNCGEEHCWDEYRAPYCDQCGAKMDFED